MYTVLTKDPLNIPLPCTQPSGTYYYYVCVECVKAFVALSCDGSRVVSYKICEHHRNEAASGAIEIDEEVEEMLDFLRKGIHDGSIKKPKSVEDRPDDLFKYHGQLLTRKQCSLLGHHHPDLNPSVWMARNNNISELDDLWVANVFLTGPENRSEHPFQLKAQWSSTIGTITHAAGCNYSTTPTYKAVTEHWMMDRLNTDRAIYLKRLREELVELYKENEGIRREARETMSEFHDMNDKPKRKCSHSHTSSISSNSTNSPSHRDEHDEFFSNYVMPIIPELESYIKVVAAELKAPDIRKNVFSKRCNGEYVNEPGWTMPKWLSYALDTECNGDRIDDHKDNTDVEKEEYEETYQEKTKPHAKLRYTYALLAADEEMIRRHNKNGDGTVDVKEMARMAHHRIKYFRDRVARSK